ncbi:UspA domain protein [Sulfitobacter noctilucicola]|uniref:Nucleotide-binding universal stress UspA family protein n=1 Tax=Sulfitobacter noctilucicola TaxID=1342301 RepID=A0A7W6M5G1_9RHOB|nr:universal stress protein [Sulfitobacter noctilucicola]KIN62678.1 UspA domain protein [Sulfitobacter noctilucicola]MBB4172789.1 nucleotide-binding universal stress UspA family protein [Sulfitobacter noctilucicola]
MGPKTILVCLTTPEHTETLLKVAAPLARKHGAHLIGLHTIEALVVYPGIAMHIPDTAFATFNESQKEEADAIKEIFVKHTKSEDFVSEFRLIKAEAQSAADRMVESARAADLVIMAHEDKDSDRYDQRHAQVRVIREGGRPVIVVPLDYDGPEIGKNILLGWSDTREAARAAHDMLGLADAGAELTVLRVGDRPQDAFKDSDAIDLTEMFARHGLKPTLEHKDPMGDSIAEVLNTTAFEKGADLIVTGAFGHSRAYDFVIGATSYALLRDQKIPVLFSK